MTAIRKQLICAAFLLAAMILSVGSAHADAFNYTFSGNGSGAVNAVAFTNQDFTFVLTGNTADIDASGPPFFRLFNLGGTFTEGGSTQTLLSTIQLVANAQFPTPPSSLGGVNFFNATANDGLGLFTSALSGYGLSTAIGPLTGTLNPTLGGGSFATTTGSVSITADNTLTFTAAPVTTPTPEPTSIALLGVGLAAMVLLRRRSGLLASS